MKHRGPPEGAGRAEVIRLCKQQRDHLIPAPEFSARAASAVPPELLAVHLRTIGWLPLHRDRPAAGLEHLAQHLHRLGPRALYEFIAELVARFGSEVAERVEAYGRIDPALLRAFDGHRFPPRLVVVDGGRR